MTDLNNDVGVLEARKDRIKELQASAPNLIEESLTPAMLKWFDDVCTALSPLIEMDEQFNLRHEIDILIDCLKNNGPATEQRKNTAVRIKTTLAVALSSTEGRILDLNNVSAPPFGGMG